MNDSKRQLKPVHPGEILLEEFLKPKKLSQNRLALDIGVPSRRINELYRGSGVSHAFQSAPYSFNSSPDRS